MLKKIAGSLTLFLLAAQPAFSELNLELPDLNLPDMGGSTATVSQDRDIGLSVVRNLRKHYPVVEDPELSNWIQSIGNKIANKAPRHGKLYFLLVKDPDVNAFATAGGVVVINTGLVLYTESESELAAVIAHEIAHVTQNHISRRIAQSKGNILGTGAALLAGIAVGSQNPDAGSAIITTTMAAQQHQQLSYSREMEAEADRVGIRLLSSAGYKASGMPDFMSKLDRLTDNPNSQLTKYLQSHPLSIERISDTRSRAQRLGQRGKENTSYLYAREKIRALMNPSLQSQTPDLPNPAVKNYSKAVKLMALGQYQNALQILGTSNKHLPEAIAIAESLNHTRQYQQTIQLLTPLAKLRPGDQSVLVPLCNALLGTGNVEQAWHYLKQAVPNEQTSLEFFEVKQEVARHKGYIADAYLAAAERNIRIGENKHAIAQLRQAIKLPGISGQDAARLQTRLQAIQR